MSITRQDGASIPADVGIEGWPVPDHFALHSSAPCGNSEPAMIEMTDGRHIPGVAMRLDWQTAMLEFRPDAAESNQYIRFSSFKSLRLSRAIDLEQVPLFIPPQHVEAMPAMSRLNCTIRFSDGSELSSGIVGIVARRIGLFLFLADDDGRATRWFLPAEATTGCRIGDPLGKILVERGIVTARAVEAGLERQREKRATRFGDYLSKRNIVTREQLEACLDAQKTLRHLKLGELLVERGLITPQQRDEALTEQARDRETRIGEILVEMGAVSKKALWQVLVDQIGLPWVNLYGFRIEPEAIGTIPADLARRHRVIPLYRTASRMAVALEYVMGGDVIEEIERLSQLKVDPVLTSREDLDYAIQRFYGQS
jgi:hypothetical protein